MTVPKPKRAWRRFRLRSLLWLTLLAAVGFASWRGYVDWAQRRLIGAKSARNASLQDWRQVYRGYQQGTASPAAEGRARETYFVRRAAVEEALDRVRWLRGDDRQ